MSATVANVNFYWTNSGISITVPIASILRNALSTESAE
jgi:hypothetical protein